MRLEREFIFAGSTLSLKLFKLRDAFTAAILCGAPFKLQKYKKGLRHKLNWRTLSHLRLAERGKKAVREEFKGGRETRLFGSSRELLLIWNEWPSRNLSNDAI